ncbi:Proteasome subunit beta [Spraguea lophii 42_110]|uniref:Proteasome subunit beta n=1 Tax=Spraguea lophii (strain 42_110) TaxID=1358809 RepID=S7XKS3_SPRLO|nr:Proteasome subunit beta [Spraguea lophii 42_110]
MFTKTGTTIVGVKYKYGVVLAADTRSTNGDIVVNKHCNKIHYISDNIYTCGAGTAADIDRISIYTSKKMNIFEKEYNRIPRVAFAANTASLELFRYMGYKSAALLMGGIDDLGVHLITVNPHGSTFPAEYNAQGSGSLAAIGILEAGYKENMEESEAVKLAVEAIKAGILNDLYSGTEVNMKIIKQDNKKGYKIEDTKFPVSVREDKDIKKFKYPLTSIKITKSEVINMIKESE